MRSVEARQEVVAEAKDAVLAGSVVVTQEGRCGEHPGEGCADRFLSSGGVPLGGESGHRVVGVWRGWGQLVSVVSDAQCAASGSLGGDPWFAEWRRGQLRVGRGCRRRDWNSEWSRHLRAT